MPQAIAFLPAAPSTRGTSSSSTSIEITNAFISASLKAFRVFRQQLALNISIYHSNSISTGLTAKIKPSKKQETAVLGLPSHTSASQTLHHLHLPLGYSRLSSLQKSFS